MELTNLARVLKKEVNGIIKISESMSRHTTWQIGGPADLLLIPNDWIDIEKALKFANINKLPVTLIGGGSNLLVADQGIRGLVIKLAGGLKNVLVDGEKIIADAGVRLPYLAHQVANKGLSGLEFAAGIPGTLGGAILMNAGAHGGQMADIVQSIVAMDKEGRLLHITNEQLGFAYRTSKLKKMDVIIIEAHLKLLCGDVGEIKKKMEENLQFRQEKQPWELPNAGSVFKNPPGNSAGRLIDSVGAKGWQVGKAQVSEKHANFIVNLGGATSQDVLSLMTKIQRTVEKEHKVLLEPEILVVGG